jgi:hypothetical protein
MLDRRRATDRKIPPQADRKSGSPKLVAVLSQQRKCCGKFQLQTAQRPEFRSLAEGAGELSPSLALRPSGKEVLFRFFLGNRHLVATLSTDWT